MELSLLRLSNYHAHAFAKILAKEICDILSDSSVGKESACQAGDVGSIPGSGRSPVGGNGNTLQYSCLENLMDRGAWWPTVQRTAKSQTPLSH